VPEPLTVFIASGPYFSAQWSPGDVASDVLAHYQTSHLMPSYSIQNSKNPPSISEKNVLDLHPIPALRVQTPSPYYI